MNFDKNRKNCDILETQKCANPMLVRKNRTF